MLKKDNIIFESAHTPNQNWVKDLDPRDMDSSLSSFKAPINDNRVVTLCRPLRIYRLFKNLFKKDFLPNDLLEQRIYDFFVRLKLNRKAKINL